MRRHQFGLVLLAAVTVCLATAACGKVLSGKWASNGVFGLKVDKVETIVKWQQLAPFQRIGKGDEAQFSDIKKALSSGQYKVVVLHVSMRNDSKDKQLMGYSRWGGDTGNRGSVYECSSVLFLRGKEGTELSSLHYMKVDDYYAGSALTYYLEGGLPMKSDVPPKGVIKGRLAFVVRDWFVPARLFIKGYYSGGEKKPELAVPLR